MKFKKIAILVIVAFISMAAYGQLFHPLGLGGERCERINRNAQPQMHVEGDILYVCTNQGLFSKDLSSEESAWQLVGFEDVSLLDYVRKGEEMVVLSYNVSTSSLLLSHNSGKTFEDVTSDLFGGKNVLKSLAQNPNDLNKLLVLSSSKGVFQSTDFGQTWNLLTNVVPENMGYHPLLPDIIYIFGMTNYFSPYFYISYDGGQNWSVKMPYNSGDNNVYRIAFHPTDSDKWVAAGNGVVYSTTDNGQTWNIQDFLSDITRSASWRFVAYDSNNGDVIYMVAHTDDSIKIMYSVDGGQTWEVSRIESIQDKVNDLRQYGDKLLIYTESDVYEISKAELLAQSTSVHSITASTQISSVYYDLLGRRVDSPSGLTIVVTRYSDGSVRTDKKLFR